MAYSLCDKLNSLSPYMPIDNTTMIRLDANESFLPLPDDVLERMKNELSALELNRYPDPYAAEVCGKFADYVGIDADLVTAGNGSDELIGLILTAFLERGDKLLCLTPDFPMYEIYSHLTENPVVKIKNLPDCPVTVDAILEQIKAQNIKMMMFSNPCNPTGQGLMRDDIRRLVAETSCLFVVDEAYMDFWDQSILNEADQYSNVIVLKTCSKALSAAAIRLGFAVANSILTRALRAAKSPFNVNAVTQKIGTIMLDDKKSAQNRLCEIEASKKQLEQGLFQLAERYPEKIVPYPSKANFIFIKVWDAEKVHRLLFEQNISVRLLGENLRISAGWPEENKQCLQCLNEILRKEG